MSGFCPHDFHGTTEEDLRQMEWGRDYEAYAPHRFRPSSKEFLPIVKQPAPEKMHDEEIELPF